MVCGLRERCVVSSYISLHAAATRESSSFSSTIEFSLMLPIMTRGSQSTVRATGLRLEYISRTQLDIFSHSALSL